MGGGENIKQASRAECCFCDQDVSFNYGIEAPSTTFESSDDQGGEFCAV